MRQHNITSITPLINQSTTTQNHRYSKTTSTLKCLFKYVTAAVNFKQLEITMLEDFEGQYVYQDNIKLGILEIDGSIYRAAHYNNAGELDLAEGRRRNFYIEKLDKSYVATKSPIEVGGQTFKVTLISKPGLWQIRL